MRDVDRLVIAAMRESRAWPAVFGFCAAHELWRAAYAALTTAGFVVVPHEPTPEMIAAAIPVKTASAQDKRTGAAACLLLSGGAEIIGGGEAIAIAARMCADYRAMINAAPKIGGENV